MNGTMIKYCFYIVMIVVDYLINHKFDFTVKIYENSKTNSIQSQYSFSKIKANKAQNI